MGRDIDVYAISPNLTHCDPNSKKQVCMGWNCVPCAYYDDSKGDILKSLRAFIEKQENEACVKLRMLLQKYDESTDIVPKNKTLDEIIEYLCEKDMACPLCHWYCSFQTDSTWTWDESVLVKNFNIHHSYGNPIWLSDWCFRNFVYQCPIDTRFPSDYDSFYKVTAESLDGMRNYLHFLKNERGDPLRTPDKEALKETNETIDWMDDAIHNKGMICIIQNEP